jgi:hypothetical protein
MAINTPEGTFAGDLARVKSQEMDDEWPEMIEIVAYWGPGRKKRKSITISSDQFFGRNGYNAPISPDQLILIINRLRKGET